MRGVASFPASLVWLVFQAAAHWGANHSRRAQLGCAGRARKGPDAKNRQRAHRTVSMGSRYLAMHVAIPGELRRSSCSHAAERVTKFGRYTGRMTLLPVV